MLTLLTRRNVLVRAAAAWVIGAAALCVTWAGSYYLLPSGVLRGWSSLAARLPITGGDKAAPPAFRIFAWNACLGGGITVLGSLFSVGRFPIGYLAPWAWFAIYGVLLGTNSFAMPNPGGRIVPSLAVIWTRSGVREISSYVLIAAALADIYLWRQRAWWDWRVERVRRWRDLRLAAPEASCLVLAVLLLAWAASVEAWQIVHMRP